MLLFTFFSDSKNFSDCCRHVLRSYNGIMEHRRCTDLFHCCRKSDSTERRQGIAERKIIQSLISVRNGSDHTFANLYGLAVDAITTGVASSVSRRYF